MAKICPNCDKPLRDGAKFCTACGHVLQKPEMSPLAAETPPSVLKQDAPPPKPAPTPPAASPAGTFCRHCGKGNRPGVKFCATCGKPISAPQPAPPPLATPAQRLPIDAPPVRSRARLLTVSFLVLVILMVCVSIVGIGWGFGVDVLLFPTATPGAEGSLELILKMFV
jgi:Meckel syndrome type 1 protein